MRISMLNVMKRTLRDDDGGRAIEELKMLDKGKGIERNPNESPPSYDGPVGKE